MKYRALAKAIAHLVVCAGLIGGSSLAVPHVALQAMAQTKPTQGTQQAAQADGNAPTMPKTWMGKPAWQPPRKRSPDF